MARAHLIVAKSLVAIAPLFIVTPAFAQYTVDTAIQSSVLENTRKIDGKAHKGSGRMTAEQRAFWKDYCTKWPKGGTCDSYRREVARYPDPAPAKRSQRR